MKERIVFAPGLNGRELLVNLALHGKNSFNLRVCDACELARIALMRSNVHISSDFVSKKEEVLRIEKAVKGEKYFESSSYADLQKIADAIRLMRSLVPSNDEEQCISEIMGKGIFQDKNNALVSVYRKYVQILKDENAVDGVSLIRMAIEKCDKLDSEFIELKEYPLNPLEKALLNKLSGGNVLQKKIVQLYEKTEAEIDIEEIRNCYGEANEIETILSEIYKANQVDQCVVAITDKATYSQLLFDYAVLHDVPMSFGCGIPIANSNPAKLLKLYSKWSNNGVDSAVALKEMLSSSAFDRSKLKKAFPCQENFHWNTFYDILVDLRLTPDETTNKKRLDDFKKAIEEDERDAEGTKDLQKIQQKKSYISALEVVASELVLQTEEFIDKYAYIRRGSDSYSAMLLMALDNSAAMAISRELKMAAGLDNLYRQGVVQSILNKNVCFQKSEEGKLYVTDIDGAIPSLRSNLYVAGLSASLYPGAPKENYLLLDDDIEKFGKDEAYMTSAGQVTKKNEKLIALTALASALGNKVYLSYSGFNVSELKKNNASSLVYKLYTEKFEKSASLNGLNEFTKKVGYFDPAISVTREIGKAYISETPILKNSMDCAKTSNIAKLNFNTAYSPSALKNFFNCPRSFMLSNLLGIPTPEDDSPFEVIAANERGTLAHSLMEKLADEKMTLEDFIKLSGEFFDRFIAEHPAYVEERVASKREEFLAMMETAYKMDPKREVVFKEEDVKYEHESGVVIHGFPDRMEKLEDGSYLIVDFKTGRTIEHIKDDIDTCLQIVIYAYLMERMGFKVSGGEFRYLQKGETVSCKYDDEMKKLLSEKLTLFKHHLEIMDFPIPESALNKEKTDESPCKYCKFGLVCGKIQDEGESDDE